MSDKIEVEVVECKAGKVVIGYFVALTIPNISPGNLLLGKIDNKKKLATCLNYDEATVVKEQLEAKLEGGEKKNV